MFNMITSKKAMTLTEIIIVALLVSVVIGAGITSFILQQSMLKSQMARSNIQDQVSIAIAYIYKDIFRSEGISHGNATGGFVDFTIGTPVVVDSTDHVRVGIGTDLNPGAEENIVYSLNGTDLQRNGATIARDITALTFDAQGNNLVNVTIAALDGTQNITSSTAMALRATRA